MTDVILGGAVLASFLAGMVALFAPCCISVMLPAYLASSFSTKRALVAMTFVFAAGLGLIILPIALGAAALGALINANHTIVYLVGAAFMFALGAYMILGGQLALPMPGVPIRQGRGPLAVLSLGAFSGVSSACCAPVLAGLVALAGATASFGAALTLGVAYVFGMAFPLFVIALLWDRFDWGESPLLRGRRFAFRLLGRQVEAHSTALASGGILIAMSAVAVYIALSGNAMSYSDWQLQLSASVEHYAAVIRNWLALVPGWLTALAIGVALVALAWVGLRQARSSAQPSASTAERPGPDEESHASAGEADHAPEPEGIS